MFKHRVGQMLPQAELVFIAVPLNRDEKTSPSLRPLRARAKRARGNN